jgi:hypothetical protein
MITGAYLLLAIGGILSLGGWVMLLVLGFKKSIGWGLVILFLSWLIVPVIIFLARYWSESKTGFFLMLAGTIASGIGWFAVVGSLATSAIAEFESFDLTQPEVVIEQEQASPFAEEEPQPVVTADAETPAAAAEEEVTDPLKLLPTPTPLAQPTPAGTVLGERVEWHPLLDLASLPSYEGELIELVMRDGTRLRVTLDAVERDVLLVTQRVGGGALGYTVKRELITEIQVMK